MTEKRLIKDIDITIITGQIMSRVKVNEASGEEAVETRKVLIPKAINSDGTVSLGDLPEEKLNSKADEKRITKKGDIVIKLSTPYDAALIDEESENLIVPSFCAIVRNGSDISNDYLLAFLNSKLCKKQLADQVAGYGMSVLSVGKVKNVEIPIPSYDEQIAIGEAFTNAQAKIKMIKRIMELESKRNDALFDRLSK